MDQSSSPSSSSPPSPTVPAAFGGRDRACVRASACDKAVATHGAPLIDAPERRVLLLAEPHDRPHDERSVTDATGHWLDRDGVTCTTPPGACPIHWSARFATALGIIETRRLGTLLVLTRSTGVDAHDRAIIDALIATVRTATAPALTGIETIVDDGRAHPAPPFTVAALDFARDGARDIERARELVTGRSRALDPELPTRQVSLCADRHCALRCARSFDSFSRGMLDAYVARSVPFDGQRKAAIIDLDDLTMDDYTAQVKQHGKGSALRQAKKADRAGYVCHPFERGLHIPDIVEINHSMPTRSGGAMRREALGTIESMGGAPTKRLDLAPDACPVHARRWWGAFQPEPGYTQGTVTTDERLVAYISLSRMGDLVLYSLILGHGDHLRHGVMFRLHFQIMAWILERDEPFTRGIRTVVYAGFYQGTDGLRQWKRNTAFTPAYLTIDSDEITEIERRRNAPSVRLARGARQLASSVRRRGRSLVGRLTP